MTARPASSKPTPVTERSPAEQATKKLRWFSLQNRTLLWYARWAYVVVFMGVLIYWRTFWTPDVLFIFLIGLFVLMGQGKKFIHDFSPFIVLLLVYDSLRGLANSLHGRIHYYEMINFDKWLGGGTIPTTHFQNWLYHGSVQWYDLFLYFLYIIHFAAPIGLAVLIWKTKPKEYWRFVTGFLLVSYLGFLTFILFPAAPPWMAAQMHLIPDIARFSDEIAKAFGAHGLPNIYSQINPNPVAAVPSLHVAYPTLLALFVFRIWGPKVGIPLTIYPLLVMFGVVYLGEHYVFDVVAGVLFAAGSFLFANFIFDKAPKRHHQKLRYAKAIPFVLLVVVLVAGKI